MPKVVGPFHKVGIIICHHYHKISIITIIFIIASLIIIIGIVFFLSNAQNIVLTSKKRGPTWPNWGWGSCLLGQRPKKTDFFSANVFLN